MSKLCQCLREKILDQLWDRPGPYEEEVNHQLERIEGVLASECTCQEKKECDHIVGVQDGDSYEVSDKLIYLSEYNSQVDDYFKYCPECGEKLNLK